MPRRDRTFQRQDRIARIDRAVHSPARLKILTLLASIERADFVFLLNQTSLTRGNLASHLGKLEETGYVTVTKEFVDKVPRTLIRLSATGRKAIREYRDNMRRIIDGLVDDRA